MDLTHLMMKAIQIKLKVKLGWNINANEKVGTRITAKYLIKEDGIYPYVSARNIRYGIRQKFLEKGYEIDWYKWESQKKELKDSADPIKYVDNDIFGYLYPIGDIGSIKRVSPVWTSPWLSDEPIELSTDQLGKFPRKEGQPMLAENEVYPPTIGTVYFVITDRIGKFDYYEVFSKESEEFVRKIVSEKKGSKKGELSKEIENKFNEFNEYIKNGYINKEDDKYVLVKDLKNRSRYDRIKDLLTILLKEGWIPARKAQYLYLPEYIKAEIYAVNGIKSFSILEKRDIASDKDFIEKRILLDYKEDTEKKIEDIIEKLSKFLQ